MAPKRASREEGNDDRDRQVPGKRRHGDPEQAVSRTVANGNTTNDIALCLEPIIRKVLQDVIPPMLQEVIPHILQRHLPPCCGLTPDRQTGTSGGRALQLCFMNKLPSTIFTQSKITAESGAPLQIELRDAAYQRRIVGEEGSSMKIQMHVVDGDLGSNGSEYWTAEEFNAKTLSPREGKGPLLNGDTVIKLENGVGYITKKLVFTDNSSWTRSGKFRLGVKILQSTSIGADIREGLSEPFKVKDNRGEKNKKHDCPSLNDEVWRLKKIRKDGVIHKQLSSLGIKTVKDLLQLYITNQASLREKIGNLAGQPWDAIIEHAKACDIDDDKRYIYYHYCAEDQLISLVFNCIYEVVEVNLSAQNSRSLQSLNLEEKRLVERVKQQAYNNLKDLIPLETATLGLVNTSAEVQAAPCGAPDQGLQQFDFPIAQQGQPETGQYLCQPSTSASYIDEAAHCDLVDFDQLPAVGQIPLDWSTGEQLTSGAYIEGNGWPGSGTQIDQFASYFCPSTTLEQENIFYPPYGYGAQSSNHSPFPNAAVYISSKEKRRTVWHKIRTALKWVKLHVAIRKAKPFRCQC